MCHSLFLSHSFPSFTLLPTKSFKHSPPNTNHFPFNFSSSLSKPPHAFSPSLKNLSASRAQTLGYTGHDAMKNWVVLQMFRREMATKSRVEEQSEGNDFTINDHGDREMATRWATAFLFGQTLSVVSPEMAYASNTVKMNEIYEVGELFDLGIQLLYLLLLLGLLGAGTYSVIRQVLVRRELDLSAKELQEQIRSGDADATGLYELGAVMLRRKFYPAATKYLLQAIEKWDGDDQDLAQVYNALGVSYVRDDKLEKGITQFETAVKLQPGYVTAWNNLGDAYEKKKEYKAALMAFEEVLLFDPDNKIAQPRRDAMKEQVEMYKGVPLKSKEKR
ncbi:PREDICTED: uncharacterized protein LOC109325941 isoform X2 [Lupinus angustifolius]|uniref:uncharacterized protein LOC109325941 isoform X2 n=1 Tax=Lupinus angustifolius TaxID=3871 RepID=UPI00092E44F6|nr:PREDICTED: uncharacterized protein LOC109325941 isoform X2 [Lupinus angustifolius]